MLDPENLDGQIREAIIGLTMNWKLIYVVYTMRKGYRVKQRVFRV